jgi:phospholipase D1/2
MHDQKSVFRIECEYANGAARWVVYRELRDFISLHAHYTVANVYKRSVQIDKLPEFPRTSALLSNDPIVVASNKAAQVFHISSF